jgi:steroid delta-isomerase-like uncharacterized protein
MSDLAKTARDYLETWNKRDWEKYKSFMHPQYSYTGGDGNRMDGPDSGVAVGQMFATAFPDGRINFKQIHASDNTVVVEFTGEGTHTGDFAGVPASGRKINILVCDVIEFRDGKIIAEREYIDMLSMMQQIGAIPQGAAV